MFPEQDGQLSGEPVRSLAIKCSACAGLYVAGRGLRIELLQNCKPDPSLPKSVLKTNRLGTHIQVVRTQSDKGLAAGAHDHLHASYASALRIVGLGKTARCYS